MALIPIYQFYLDTCALIAYYNPRDPKDQHTRIKSFLNKIHKKRSVRLCISDFTIAEFLVAMHTIPNIRPQQISQAYSQLSSLKKIGGKYKFKIVYTEGDRKREDYYFDDFWVGLQEILLETKPGLADTIHAQIMKNNNIETIITFDTKHFDEIIDVEPLDPDDFEDLYMVTQDQWKKVKRMDIGGVVRAILESKKED